MPHQVSQRIKAFNADRLPDKLRRKYKAMRKDAFRFYRGTCHLFYEDLAKGTPLPLSPLAWLCGDLHPENFGSYKADNRLVYFDVSDFDEALLGPALWDVARMATGILVMFESLELKPELAQGMARHFLKVYAATLAEGKAKHIEAATATGEVRKLLEEVQERKKDEWLRARVEEGGNGHLVFVEKEDKQELIADGQEKQALLEHMAGQGLRNKNDERYEVLDVCFRLAGTGSLGLKRYLFLLQSPAGKKMLVDMKEARPSSLAPYATAAQPAWPSEADRVVALTERMQDVPRALLQATTFENASYKIQEMQPSEDKVDSDDLKRNPLMATAFFADAAALTASVQLRSAGRQGSATADDLIAFGKDESWREALLRYAEGYTQQVLKDHADYKEDFDDRFFKNENGGSD